MLRAGHAAPRVPDSVSAPPPARFADASVSPRVGTVTPPPALPPPNATRTHPPQGTRVSLQVPAVAPQGAAANGSPVTPRVAVGWGGHRGDSGHGETETTPQEETRERDHRVLLAQVEIHRSLLLLGGEGVSGPPLNSSWASRPEPARTANSRCLRGDSGTTCPPQGTQASGGIRWKWVQPVRWRGGDVGAWGASRRNLGMENT